MTNRKKLMNRKKIISLSLLSIIASFVSVYAQKEFITKSPNGRISVSVTVDKTISYSVLHDDNCVLEKSVISMSLSDGTSFGITPRLEKMSKTTVDETIEAVIYKRNKIDNNYNELSLTFKGDYKVIFRVYNDGMAYRFVSSSKKPFIVENEKAEFNFPDNSKAHVAYVKSEGNSLEDQYFNSFENIYQYLPLSEWDKKRLAFSPLVVDVANGKKVCIAEADLINYPGMFLYSGDNGNSLKGVFAPYPKVVEQGGYNLLQGIIKEREAFIAKYDKGTYFPWRLVIVAENDYELADNDMVYKLATAPNQFIDYSWIKPGKVAWDWWNDWTLYSVDFQAGINNDTYKYYIDFASAQGIEYVILDEGWSVNQKADLLQVIPEINLEELVAYAEKRNVGLILWAGYYAFDRDMENICKHYSKMGIKGFKIDFMDRDDQLMVDFHHRAAEVGAKYRLLIDFHGTYKPTGLQRTYPNVINFEGVHGLETMKWSAPSVDQVTYDVTIPFIRQVAGPVDYTQGAMRNAIRSNYYPVNSEAMSQGTRCRQLAQYIIFESPLNMLCDSPSNYMREPECTRFITNIPTIWDNTIALNGEIGKYITIARRSRDVWYIGSMTNWDERVLELDLSFLGDGKFKGEVFKDGINANKAARDYKKESIDISSDNRLRISMAPGGGYVIKITKTE